MSARLVELEPEVQVGRFRVTREVGRGGHGIVYEACDPLLGRRVALKTLAISRPDSSDMAAAREEAYLLSQVMSPHVAAIYDLFHHGEAAVLVMEFVPGPTLETKIRGGALPWPEVGGLAVQLAQGLAALHDAGIVHRDIKPSNLRLSGTGLVKILDLGVARSIPSRRDEVVDDGDARLVVGTIPYMSPEQLEGRDADVRSDIYGLGAVLYELATGCRLFDALRDRAQGGRATPPAHLRTLVPGVPLWMDRIIARAVQKNPGARFQTARELGAALSAELDVARVAASSTRPVTAGIVRGWFPGVSNDATGPESLQAATNDAVHWGEYWRG
jgi:eukaryotic-like serine/threonine-protein kinase